MTCLDNNQLLDVDFETFGARTTKLSVLKFKYMGQRAYADLFECLITSGVDGWWTNEKHPLRRYKTRTLVEYRKDSIPQYIASAKARITLLEGKIKDWEAELEKYSTS